MNKQRKEFQKDNHGKIITKNLLMPAIPLLKNVTLIIVNWYQSLLCACTWRTSLVICRKSTLTLSTLEISILTFVSNFC